MNHKEVRCRPGKVKHLVVGDKVFKSVHDCELNEKDCEKACVELGETEEKKKKCLQEFKQKLLNDKNCNYYTDDSYLLRFLRTRKYDVEKAYENVKLFYEFRKKTDFLDIPQPQDLKNLLETRYMDILPYTDEEGTIFFLANIGKWNAEEVPFGTMLQMICTVCDVVSMNPKSQINGVIGIWNYTGFTRKHFQGFWKNGYPSASINIMQRGYPYRIKGLIIVNASQIVRYFYRMFRPLLSKKIVDRLIIIGSDLSELHKLVNPAILPKSLGGELDEDECRAADFVMDNLTYLRYERSFS